MAIQKSRVKALKKAVETGPYYRHLGMSLEEVNPGFARFRMPFREELLQNNGVVHGGAIASLADTAVAYALLTLLQPGEWVTTVELKMNFLAAVKGEEMFGEGRVVRRGRRLALIEMEVKDAKGTLIAKGLATYLVRGLKQTEGD